MNLLDAKHRGIHMYSVTQYGVRRERGVVITGTTVRLMYQPTSTSPIPHHRNRRNAGIAFPFRNFA